MVCLVCIIVDYVLRRAVTARLLPIKSPHPVYGLDSKIVYKCINTTSFLFLALVEFKPSYKIWRCDIGSC